MTLKVTLFECESQSVCFRGAFEHFVIMQSKIKCDFVKTDFKKKNR